MSNSNTNEIKNMPRLYGGKLAPEFNTNDFQTKKGYVTYADLLNYANLYTVNIFYSLNQFTAIVVKSINDISDTTLSYLKNVNSDIQEQFNNIINNILYGYSYDSVRQLTSITNDTYLNSMSTPNNIAVSGNASISGILNISLINSMKCFCQNLVTNTLSTNSLMINNIPVNDLGVYLYCTVQIESYGAYTASMLTIPIYKSITCDDLNIQPSENFTCFVTIKPNYTIQFIDSNNNVLNTLTNNTNNVLYFQPITLVQTLTKVNIYYNYILI